MASKATILPANISKEVQEALGNFYHQSVASSEQIDHKRDDEASASRFTSDGVYGFMGCQATGPQEILTLRQTLYDEVPHRQPRLKQVFTSDDNDLELMALGAADYKHHSGEEYDREFAGHYILENVGGS
ncbi:MAG: hypothetical protein Q9160_007286 [Pyrenula sp. 1 TL-2023]